jgi:hypothetical protein
MTYGEYRRTKPRVNVLRGYEGNESRALTYSAEPTADEAIKSGMVISISSGKWVKGCAAGKKPYIAFHDQSDTDVQSSGLLLGLSCAGNYEIETGYYDVNDTYAQDDALIAGTSSLAGYLDKASGITATADILGFVSNGGVQDLTAQNSESTPVSGKIEVLCFTTHWLPNRE